MSKKRAHFNRKRACFMVFTLPPWMRAGGHVPPSPSLKGVPGGETGGGTCPLPGAVAFPPDFCQGEGAKGAGQYHEKSPIAVKICRFLH